jgi:protein AroM
MKRKIGFITIGQSPRVDVVPEMSALLCENIEIFEAGALDGLTKEDIASFAPKESDYVLVSSLNDGSHAKFAEKHIISRLQNCIRDLESKEVALIVFLCSGEFPTFKSSVPLIFPEHLLKGNAAPFVSSGSLGAIFPDEQQIPQQKAKWESCVKNVIAFSGSPYQNDGGILKAARALKNTDAAIIVLDCIGYNREMKKLVSEITQKPVMTTRTMTAHFLAEVLEF